MRPRHGANNSISDSVKPWGTANQEALAFAEKIPKGSAVAVETAAMSSVNSAVLQAQVRFAGGGACTVWVLVSVCAGPSYVG